MPNRCEWNKLQVIMCELEAHKLVIVWIFIRLLETKNISHLQIEPRMYVFYNSLYKIRCFWYGYRVFETISNIMDCKHQDQQRSVTTKGALISCVNKRKLTLADNIYRHLWRMNIDVVYD